MRRSSWISRISSWLGVALAAAGVFAPSVRADEAPGEFGCRASALRVTSPLIEPVLSPQLIEPSVANPTRYICQDDADEAGEVRVGNSAKADLASVRTDDEATFGRANAAVATAKFQVGDTVVTAELLESKARAACSADTGEPLVAGSSTVVGLKVNGQAVEVTAPPNPEGLSSAVTAQTINASPLVVVAVNERIQTPDSVKMRALRISSATLGVTVVVAESIADASSCAQRDPRLLEQFIALCEAAGGDFSYHPRGIAPEEWRCTKTVGTFTFGEQAGLAQTCQQAGFLSYYTSTAYDPTRTLPLSDQFACLGEGVPVPE